MIGDNTRGWPNSLSAAFSYDGANRPIGETVGSLAAFTRAYDRDGNVVTETQSLTGISGVAGGGTQTYTYDNVGRVLTDTMTDSGSVALWVKSFTYDADSNRVGVNDAGVATAYEFSSLDQIVASTAGGLRTSFEYDSYGNMTRTFVNPAGTPQTPAAATNLAATAVAYNQVNLTWTAPAGATPARYAISRGGTPLTTVAGNVTSMTDWTTAASTGYSYTITAIDSSGTASSAAGPATVTTPAPAPPADTTAPTTPTNLTATLASPSEIDLAWTASTDNVAVAGYRVYRNATLIATTASTTYADTPLAAGSSNTYHVVAIDGSGNTSGDSGTASASTPAADTTAPTVPTNVAAVPATGSVAVTWTASTDAVGVTSYTITRGTTVISTVAGTATGFTDYSTTPDTQHSYTVTASDAAGNTSAASSSASATTPADVPPADTTAPTTPTNLTATLASQSEIDLAWTASTDNVAVAGYRVYRNATLIATTASTTYADTPLAAGSSNTYHVVAIDGSGNTSGDSGTASASTPAADTTAPTVPTNVAAVPATGSVAVTWTASTDAVGVTSYTITRGTTVISTVAGTATGFTDYSTTPDTQHSYTVTASDAAGNTSAASSGATATTPAYVPPTDTTAPSVPADLTATALVKRIDLAWSASTDDSAVAAYEISRDGTVIAVTYSPTYSDLALAEGTAHSYTVRALDGAGNASAQSTVATATAYPNPPPQVAYTYDLADRLTAITSVSGSTTSFGIDALGRHASQTVTGSPTQSYGYLGTTNTVVAIASGSVTTRSAIDATGSRVATGSGSAYGYLLADLHGNTAGAFDASCTAVTDAFAYDAYGNTVAAVTSSLPTPWRFQGRILESATGTPDLYDFGARSYAPGLGAFTSLDSVHGSAQNPALLNGYLYANANPATLVDPDGHLACRYGREDCDAIAKTKTTNSSPASSGGGGVCPDGTHWCGNTSTKPKDATWTSTGTSKVVSAWDMLKLGIGRGSVRENLNTVHHCDDPFSCAGDFVNGLGNGFMNWPTNQLKSLECLADIKCIGKDPLGFALSANPMTAGLLMDIQAAQNINNGDYYALGQQTGNLAAGVVVGYTVGGILGDLAPLFKGSAAATGDATAATAADSSIGTASSVARDPIGCSFTRDTQVATSAGSTAIGSLHVGDTIEAYDPTTGETGPHTVTAVMSNLDPVVEHLKLDSGPIETTPNHPFFTVDRGWVEAGQLVVGEQIRTESGQDATVVSFTLEATPSTMWDITVDGAHSFFVGSGAVLVHNCGPTIKDNGLLEPGGHVYDTHVVGDPAIKSLFSPGTTSGDLQQLLSASQGRTPITYQNLQFRIQSAGTYIGQDLLTGAPTSWYTVVTDAAGNLVSMYPGFPKWMAGGK